MINAHTGPYTCPFCEKTFANGSQKEGPPGWIGRSWSIRRSAASSKYPNQQKLTFLKKCRPNGPMSEKSTFSASACIVGYFSPRPDKNPPELGKNISGSDFLSNFGLEPWFFFRGLGRIFFYRNEITGLKGKHLHVKSGCFIEFVEYSVLFGQVRYTLFGCGCACHFIFQWVYFIMKV